MGLLVEGVWQDRWYDASQSGGRFIRSESQFRNWITADGSSGPSGPEGFKAEAGRFHLYVSLACPWASRTLIFRALKGLEGFISVSAVNWLMGPEGWTFDEGPGVIPDTVNGAKRLYEVYLKANPTYSGRVTVPALWDKHTSSIVNNESAEIIRMFNSALTALAQSPAITIPKIFAARSMASTLRYMTASITASTGRVLQPRKPPMRRPCARFLQRSMSLKKGLDANAISVGRA